MGAKIILILSLSDLPSDVLEETTYSMMEKLNVVLNSEVVTRIYIVLKNLYDI